MVKRVSFLTKTIFIQFLLFSCSQWDIEGPKIPTGGIELEEVSRFSLSETISSISYADNHLLIKGYFNFIRLDVSSPESPLEVNKFPKNIYSYWDFSFTGNRMFLTTRDSSLVVYNLENNNYSSDTLLFNEDVRMIKSQKSYSFVAKRYGFYVVKHDSLKVVFTYENFESSYPPKIFIDNDYLYLANSDSIYIFSILDCEKPELIDKTKSKFGGVWKIDKSYSIHISSDDFSLKLHFMNVFSNDTLTLDLPKGSFLDLRWDNEYIFASLLFHEWPSPPDSVVIYTLNPPTTGYPSVLFRNHFDAVGQYKLASSNDYLYSSKQDTLIIFKINRFKHIWED